MFPAVNYMPLLVTMSYTFCGWGGWPCIYDLAVRKLDQIEMSRKLGIDTGIERPHEYVHTCSIYIYIHMYEYVFVNFLYEYSQTQGHISFDHWTLLQLPNGSFGKGQVGCPGLFHQRTDTKTRRWTIAIITCKGIQQWPGTIPHDLDPLFHCLMNIQYM